MSLSFLWGRASALPPSFRSACRGLKYRSFRENSHAFCSRGRRAEARPQSGSSAPQAPGEKLSDIGPFRPPQTKMSRIHGTIYRTTRMLVFDVQQNILLPVPESRNGLSLARNSAFATIARSMLPPCVFDSTKETSTPPFSFAPVSLAPEVPAISTPLRAFFRALRIEAFDRILCQKLAAFHLRFAPAESFRQPWN